MFAVVSDIHSNLEALKAVIADIEARGIEMIYCLGDVVGYGPQPAECLDLIRAKVKWSVMGNHDYGVFYEPTNFNFAAEKASFWTRDILESEPDPKLRNERWHFLGSMPMRKTVKKNFDDQQMTIEFIHASPRKPINEYIFPDDVYTNPVKVRVLFEKVDHICFVGHTHLPGVFLDEPDFYLPSELGGIYPIVDGEKAIINIGSVGQPRDKEPKASYVYMKDNQVHFVRVKYDVEKTAKKIRAIEQLDDFQADRLFEGR